MKRLNKIFLTTIAPLTVATTASLATTSCSKQTKHKPVFFKTPSIAKTIYCVNGMELDDDLIVTLQSLQGILAQQQAQIYIFGADRKESRDI
ncbi:MAG: hypothetical protein MJ233_03480 [Mycoplasmoidaceae bacterium]|nr:hypothetical protein [Mycoplasmoidaceae bacterium]